MNESTAVSFALFKNEAKKAPKLSLQELADLYIDTDDEEIRNACISTFMVKYWHYVSKWEFDCASLGKPADEYVSLLYETILLYVLKEHIWRNPNHPLYNDPNAFDKAVNTAAGSFKGNQYQYYNMDKRKANQVCASVEEQITDAGDGALEEMGIYDDSFGSGTGVNTVINQYVRRNQLIEALLIYNIATPAAFKTIDISYKYKDVDNRGRETEKSVKCGHEVFDERKCMQLMRAMNLEQISAFCNKFKVNNAEELFTQLQNTPNIKLYKHLDKIRAEFKVDKSLAVCLLK